MPADGGELMAETNGPPEEKTVEGKPVEAAQSTPATVSQPLARDLYDWASRLAAENADDCMKNYYWTPQTERLVAKLKLTKRALIGVLGVQGAGKSAAMRAIRDQLKHEFSDSTVAVKIPESGGLRGALKDAFGDALAKPLDDFLDAEVLDRVQKDSVFYQRAIQLAKRMERPDLEEKLHLLNPESDFSVDTTNLYLSPALRNLISKPRLRELEEHTLDRLLSERRVIMIDMPDYPKHDRRLIARDLDEVQGLWNRLAVSDKDTGLVIFLQKETFNYGDHFFFGKMDIIQLMPLTVTQLLEAYSRRWSGYAPFNEDALLYVAKMSRGVFRRFKRYIALAVEAWVAPRLGKSIPGHLDINFAMTREGQPETPIDLALVMDAVTDEEVMRDMDKELDGIFKKRETKELALEIIRYLSLPQLKHGVKQKTIAHDLHIEEMAVSRLIRELEQHGYVKRTSRPMTGGWGGEEKIVQMNW